MGIVLFDRGENPFSEGSSLLTNIRFCLFCASGTSVSGFRRYLFVEYIYKAIPSERLYAE